MSRAWLTVILAGVVTVAFKAAGPLLLGSEQGPVARWLEAARARLVPALFAALLVTQAFGDAQGLTLDARAAGLAAALIGVTIRAPSVVIMVVAVAVTAAFR